MVLFDSEKGKTYTVYGINLPEKIKQRLQMLGMTNGTVITVLNKKISGAVIIKLRGTRYALGKEFAKGIEIGGAENE